MTTPARPRALIIVENLPVPVDRRVWMEATTLQQAGYDVSVISPMGRGHDAAHEVLEGVHIYRHPLPPEGEGALTFVREYLTALWHETRLAWRVRRERGFDVIHACNPPDLLFLVAAPFKLLFGTRFIFDQHDAALEMYEAKFGRRDLPYHALKLAERLTYALADVVIATNESVRGLARTRGRKRDADIYTVRSGPRLDRFTPLPGGDVHRAGFQFLVGWVGVLGSQDGLDALLRIVRTVVQRGRTDIKFMIIGGGPSLEPLKALSRELQVDAYVEFTGMLTDQTDLIRRLSACDLCIATDPKTPYSDVSTMNKVLEYMALGKATLQFDLTEGRHSAGDAAEYATSGDEADFANRLLALLADPERRARMGRTGQARMRDALAWEHQAPTLLAAYARALRPARPAARTTRSSGEPV
ncbi:glycosyltransferase family 4 protein [Deinococcus maricopensis]|uniref:Glycosyl transferase group 1 n=1 Tax=Deinococcus maricopensis (strain DSM 21211 / LMG 22137 / NRRL B-23946 / LB-34) TaxID=709986 RepID=E8U3F2_DEIML|nr:glycosyltransferase family 4 protein [Deinococcus maricopensis]ADV65823.1 glycosyl transferase group 1 [Deinococcus maricopensis DSM 21211]